MDIEGSAEAKDKTYNRQVAITVVTLSVFLGLVGVKHNNIAQGMQQAQAREVDTWGQYQATKTKQHVDENSLATMRSLAAIGGGKADKVTSAEIDHVQKDISKYKSEAPGLKKQAEGYQAQYDALNVHDDQFDAADALISIAISVSAVVALVEATWALVFAWGLGDGDGAGWVPGVEPAFRRPPQSPQSAQIASFQLAVLQA